MIARSHPTQVVPVNFLFSEGMFLIERRLFALQPTAITGERTIGADGR